MVTPEEIGEVESEDSTIEETVHDRRESLLCSLSDRSRSLHGKTFVEVQGILKKAFLFEALRLLELACPVCFARRLGRRSSRSRDCGSYR